MANIDLLKIEYDRVVGTESVTINDSNYQKYGYLKDANGYYKFDEDSEEKVYFTEHLVDITRRYSHILPPPSSTSFTYADVDKEGSGRSDATGEMYRERIGYYQSINVTFDVVQGTPEGINLARILKSLPPKFTLIYRDIDAGENEEKRGTFYRGDISYDLYLFIKDSKIWRGLSTTFIQYDVVKYDDSIEPDIL